MSNEPKWTLVTEPIEGISKGYWIECSKTTQTMKYTKMTFPYTLPSFVEGGFVPGAGKDMVPAILSPGEYIPPKGLPLMPDPPPMPRKEEDEEDEP
jgi:hypothetical protein